MANFGVQLLGSVGAAFRSAGVIYCSTAAANVRRINVYEINVGQVAVAYASTDTSMLWDVSRIGSTTTLASTLITPNQLDGTGLSTALSSFGNLVTAEAVVTTQGNGLSIYSWPINQRGFNRWRALDDGDNIIVPAVTQFGLAIRMLCPGGAQAFSGIGTLAFGEA